MGKSISEEDIRKAIAGIKHPAIDHTLLELGIIKAINIESGKATIILAFPFPNIPIKDFWLWSRMLGRVVHKLKVDERS